MDRKLVRFDWAMKKLLRNKANFDILEGFLSELLKFDVFIESILESEGNKQREDDKYNRVDILVKTTAGELMLIEVQNDAEVDYFQRMLYGTSKLITEYIKEGQTYGVIKKVYSINIVYFELGQGNDYIYEFQGAFVGMNSQETLLPTLVQQYTFKMKDVMDIFPKYYILKINNFNKIAENTLEEWIYFLKNSEVKEEFKAKGLSQAKEKMYYEQLSEEEKSTYRYYQEARRIEASVKFTTEVELEFKDKQIQETEEKLIETSEKLTETSEKLTETSEKLTETSEKLTETEQQLKKTQQALQKAENERQETLQKAEHEKQQEKIQIAKKLKAEKVATSLISSITGLSATEIEML